MANTPVLINHGSFNASGAAIKTAVDGIVDFNPLLSGASLHFVGVGPQIQLIEVRVI